MAIMDSRIRWAAKWVSQNRMDGRCEHLIYKDGQLLLFRTRAEARAFIKKDYGYIATRPDLRAEPHGWQMPRVVRVSATYREVL